MKFKNYYYLNNIEHFTDTFKGDQGKQGKQGYPGEPGLVGLKGLMGPIGPDGIIGPTGPKGDAGPLGDIGARGKSGVPGISGEKGDTGVKGPQGAKGPLGPPGPRGIGGDRGLKGKKGLKGLDGPVGDSGFQYSRNSFNDLNTTCNWINVPQSDNIKTRCPNNQVMNGIRSKRMISRIRSKTKRSSCSKSGCSYYWKVEPSLTTWQVNRKYDRR